MQYLESWLRGNGCVPIYNLMEDAATAEISARKSGNGYAIPKGMLDEGAR